jgi:myo-inositol 2-dehydrogenase/D-chiro-inositol 1-dehydrogenase
MIRVGVIGTGIMGAGHSKFLTNHVDGAVVTALSDIDLDRAKKLADEIKTVKLITNNVDELINSPEVDAIIIVSPDPLHFEHLRKCLATDKFVLCEKPISTTLEDAQTISNEIAAKEEKTGKRQVVFGFMRRFDPSFIKMRDLINSGKYGKPLFLRVVSRNTNSGGITTTGLFTNIAIHDFDIYRWMFQSEWESIAPFYPNAISNGPEGLKDPLIFVAKLKNGVVLVEDVVANASYGYDTRAEVVCERGSIEIGIHGDVVVRSEFNFDNFKGGAMDENWMRKFEPAYIAELKAWVKEMESGTPNPDFATHKDALIANQVAAMGVAAIK